MKETYSNYFEIFIIDTPIHCTTKLLPDGFPSFYSKIIQSPLSRLLFNF